MGWRSMRSTAAQEPERAARAFSRRMLRAGWLRLLRVLQRPRRPRLHRIVTRRPYRGGYETAQRTDIGDQLPDLLLGDLVAERRHPVRAPFENGLVDVAGLAAVDPFVVH